MNGGDVTFHSTAGLSSVTGLTMGLFFAFVIEWFAVPKMMRGWKSKHELGPRVYRNLPHQYRNGRHLPRRPSAQER